LNGLICKATTYVSFSRQQDTLPTGDCAANPEIVTTYGL
jgi:hypothetical protein